MSRLGDRLAAHALALIDVASESRDEAAILELLRTRLRDTPGIRVAADEDTVLLYLPRERRPAPLVVFAGHVDTVPVGGAALPGRRDDDQVIGRGAADMKGALAVMLALAADGIGSTDVDIGYLFFGREEIPIGESALLPALERLPELRDTTLAIVMEPTGNQLEVGCNGNLSAVVRVRGRAAHSARPWLGDNAIHATIEALAR